MRITKLLSVLCICSAVALASPPTRQKAAMVPAVTVNLPAGQTFSLYVPETGKKIGVVPMAHGGFAGMRLVSYRVGNRVTIEVAALLTGAAPLGGANAANCEAVLHARAVPIGTYTVVVRAGPGEKLPLPDTARFGLSGISISLVEAPGPPNPLLDCCTCGKLGCCPKPNQCVGCGSCGTCCLVP